MNRHLSIALSLSLLAGCATSVAPSPDSTSSDASMEEDTMDSMMEDADAAAFDIQTETVPYATIDGTEIEGYLASPVGEGPFPGLVVIHEWWGLNDQIRGQAEEFAKSGYVALAVDMYEGQSATESEQARELSSGVQNNMDRAFSNLEQAVTFLKEQDQVKDDALASVGWCFGGGWAYQMAKNDLGLDATAMYYGRFSPHEDHTHLKTDIIGHFGEEDMGIKVDDVETFQATLQTASGEHEIYIYPGAGHAFANEENEAAYNKEAAELSWQRTMKFLEEHVQ